MRKTAMNDSKPVMLITGTRKGIGSYLAGYYLKKGFIVVGCSRKASERTDERYHHHCLDVSDEKAVVALFQDIRKRFSRLDVLINNAGCASMNHALLTPMGTMEKIFRTNMFGVHLFCREAAKVMKRNSFGRIVNFSTIAVPLNLEGEAAYASSKAALESYSRVVARDFAEMGITVNVVGPTPIDTDLLRGVPEKTIREVTGKQAIKRIGEFEDVSNVIDFFIKPESGFVTGQTIYLGGV